MQLRAALLACALLAGALPAVAQDAEEVRAKTQVCAACHGPDGNAVSADFPSLEGQTWGYLSIKLKDYQEGRRSNPLMSPMAANLAKDDMIAIANFYAAQPLKPSSFQVDDAK